MGILTRDEIVSEGQLLAGRDDMATQGAAWLQRWLDAVAASWPWPALQQEVIAVPVTAGQNYVDVGNGNGTVTERILRVLDNCWMYDTNKTFRQRIRIKHQLSSPADRIAPTTNTGKPTSARIFQSAFGTWRMYFEPLPDQSYLMTLGYIYLPSVLSSGAAIPWYPNDETMVQAVAFKVSEYHNGKDSPVTAAFQQQLAGLVSNDRIRYGSQHGVNDSLILSPSVFKPRGGNQR